MVKKFSDYIEQLLVRHDYVIVPGFGGFVLQHQPATIHNGVIRPPMQTVGFNPLLQYSDGLLAMEVSHNEKITYRSALEYIEKQAAYLYANLKVSGTLVFGNLGTMQLTAEGCITFTPSIKTDFLPANFGLSEVRVQHFAVKEEKEIRISLPRKRTYRYAAIAALLIGLLFISPYKTDTRQIDYADLFQTSHTLLYDRVHEANAISVVVNDSAIVKNFHVIVATTTNQTSAEVFCNQLKIEQSEDAHVLSPARNFHIAIQSFADEQDAIDYMHFLRDADNRFKDAWILFLP